MNDDEMVILAMRMDAVPDRSAQSFTLEHCHDCDALAWVGPKSRKAMEAGALVVCHVCIAKRMKNGEQGTVVQLNPLLPLDLPVEQIE